MKQLHFVVEEFVGPKSEGLPYNLVTSRARVKPSMNATDITAGPVKLWLARPAVCDVLSCMQQE